MGSADALIGCRHHERYRHTKQITRHHPDHSCSAEFYAGGRLKRIRNRYRGDYGQSASTWSRSAGSLRAGGGAIGEGASVILVATGGGVVAQAVSRLRVMIPMIVLNLPPRY